jgi:hypothetical protein
LTIIPQHWISFHHKLANTFFVAANMVDFFLMANSMVVFVDQDNIQVWASRHRNVAGGAWSRSRVETSHLIESAA